MKTTTIIALVLAGSFVIACSGSDANSPPASEKSGSSSSGKSGSSSSSSSSGATSSSGDGTSTDSNGTEPKVCVAKGDKGNEKGVGQYCEKSTECKTGLLCTKEFGAGPNEPWFCTTPCDDDAACGSGATCFAESRGKGCVPAACLP